MCAQWHRPGCGGATQKHHFEQGCENTSKHSKIIYTKPPFPLAHLLQIKTLPSVKEPRWKNSYINIHEKYSAIQFSIFNKKFNFIPFSWTDSPKRQAKQEINYRCIYIIQYTLNSIKSFQSTFVSSSTQFLPVAFREFPMQPFWGDFSSLKCQKGIDNTGFVDL